MKRRLIIVLSYLIPCLISKITFAQPPGDAFKNLSSLPMPSPQVASLAKYVEFPVSYYNGLAQVSFPIYEIKSGDISLPISLSYHGGGIKVQEEASWVGLGWTLNVGGVISHQIKGEDDDYIINNQFHKIYPDNYGNSYRGPDVIAKGATCYNGVFTKNGNLYNCNTLITQLNGGAVDGEPDLYVYNFGQYSGKFFNGDGNFVDISHNNIQFVQNAGVGFTALTPEGFTYTFNGVEKSWSYPSSHANYTAYYLTEIKSPKGKIVTFQYKSFKNLIDEHNQAGQSWSSQYPNINFAWGNDETVMQLPALSERYTVPKFISGYIENPKEPPGLHQSYSSTKSSNLYLDKIIFENGYMEFEKSPRDDLYGVKLDAIKIFTTTSNLIKSVPFSYSYFVSNTGDDDLYNHSKVRALEAEGYDASVNYYPESYRNRRLKLESMTVDADAHSFEYFEGGQYNTLPYKTSFNQDFWGFYNGNKGNASLIPDYALYSLQMNIPGDLSSWQGANRNPDENYIKAGSLKKVHYPTGGYSEFFYEMNQFDNLSQQQQNVYRQVTYGGVDAGVGIKKFYFTLTNPTVLNITGGLYCNGMQDMNLSSYNCGCFFCSGNDPNSLGAQIDKVDPVTKEVVEHNPFYQFDNSNNSVRDAGGYINLPSQTFSAGTYCITVNYPDNHSPSGDIPNNRRAELYVSFYEPTSTQVTSAPGAGLRVASIKQLDPLSTQVLERQFKYIGGKLMQFPLFYASTFTQYAMAASTYMMIHSDWIFYYLYSTPSMPYSFSVNGGLGGYDEVTESIVGSSSLGKTDYIYQNVADRVTDEPWTYLPGVPSAGYLDNGFLKQVSIYDKNEILLKEIKNVPAISNTSTYWAFKGRHPSEERTDFTFQNYYEFSFYPIQVGKLLTSATTEKNYVGGNFLTTDKEFSYNENGLLREEKLISSNGNAITTTYKYASDYTGVSTGWIADLKDHNMIGIPIEVYNKKNGLVTSGSFIKYSKHDNIFTPYQVYKIETNSPKDIASTAPNELIPQELKLSGTLTYDVDGNLVQTRSENNIYTSYLWGYNKTYPVAQVTGTAYTTLNALINSGSVNQSILNNPSSTENQVKQELNNLRTGLSTTKTLITTYTYKPLVGISSQTDAKGLITNFTYDNYLRLTNIKDHEGNIVKAYDYYYSPTLKNVASLLLYNEARTKIFNKQCPNDAFGRTQIGPDISYTVPAGRYAALTLTDANNKAQAEIDANGQARADQSAGDCYIYAGPLDLVSVQNGPNTSVSISYKCPYDANYLYLFIQDVATGTLINNGPYVLSKSQTHFTTTITKGKQYSFWLQGGGAAYPGNLVSQTITMNFPQ